MNTKHCVYRGCGNTSAFATKITFFSFPVKDAEKCGHWARMAGCEDINLKNKYLCENHFSTIYISKTPRRTVLLPNAMPYRYDESTIKDDTFEEDYNSEKNTSRDEILLDQLDEENDIIYSDGTIEMMRHHEDGVDENVETLDDQLVEVEMQPIAQKVKPNPLKVSQKTYDNVVPTRVKKVEKLSPNNSNVSADEYTNHVTKRHKMHTSADNIIVSNQTIDTAKPAEKVEVDADNNASLDNTVDNPDITTFIYKGEEYIQMPKRIYLQQRVKLDAEVKQLGSILQTIEGAMTTYKRLKPDSTV